VAAQAGRVMVTAFHPELTGDTRVHARFLAMVAGSRRQRRGANRGGVLPVPSEEVVS
jgi:pyridoxal 5'-phosphate synthase pdxT subunit